MIEVTTRSAYLTGTKLVKVSYNGVTFDEEFLSEGQLSDLAAELLQAAVELDSRILDGDKMEFHSEGIRQCCDWLRKEGYGELADKMINFV